MVTAIHAAGITDAREVAMFLAQLSVESKGFTRTRENLRYRPERLLALFPKRIGSLENAQRIVAGGPDAIAEALYGGRSSLGNTQAGDGARYIGRSFIQLTGRANYEAASKALGLDLVSHPELAESPENAIRIAIWFWTNRPKLRDAARRGDVEAATRIVNGGLHGLPDRRRKYLKYIERIGQQTMTDQPPLRFGRP